MEIVIIYCPLQEPFDELWLGDQFQWGNVLICGDLNAKSVLWGSPESNARGRVLEKILDECDKVVLNTGMATRWFYGERVILTWPLCLLDSLIWFIGRS